MFNVGEIIQHKKVKVYYSLITSVDISLRIYGVMYLNDGMETTLSFRYCHQEYELASNVRESLNE